MTGNIPKNKKELGDFVGKSVRIHVQSGIDDAVLKNDGEYCEFIVKDFGTEDIRNYGVPKESLHYTWTGILYDKEKMTASIHTPADREYQAEKQILIEAGKWDPSNVPKLDEDDGKDE